MAKKANKKNKPKRIKLDRLKSALPKVITFVGRLIAFLLILAIIFAAFGGSLWLLSFLNWQLVLGHFDFQILLGFVKALAWPLLVLVALLLLKKEIVALINRLRSASIGDKKVEFETPTSQPSGPLSPALEDAAEQSQETPDEARERIYARPEVQLAFERIYRNIFGTQLTVLNTLAANSNSIASSHLEGFYQRHLELLSGGTNIFTNVHDYLDYLVVNGLVNYNGDTDTYQIDQLTGPLFLRYLGEQGLSDPNNRRF